MRDFPSCFGESGVQIADSSSSSSSTSSKSSQNLVTCLYQAHLGPRPCIITVTWTKNLMGQGLSISIQDSSNHSPPLAKLEIKPYLFSKNKGSKYLSTPDNTPRIDAFWDLSSAKFPPSSPEPTDSFFVALLFDNRMVLLLGDLTKDAHRKTGTNTNATALFVAKREHLFGKRLYSTRAPFCHNGKLHDVVIDCETIGLKDPCLEIRIDRKRVMFVKRLMWKFRGNQTILVDGVPVEVFWDVHNWLFDAAVGSAVFMFQTCLSADKLLLPWSSCSQVFGGESQLRGLGFSLILYAWKNE